jgi:hypothetical protein
VGRRGKQEVPLGIAPALWNILRHGNSGTPKSADAPQPQETARIAKPLSGDLLYQRRARVALPLLVRQAESGTAISYSDCAGALGMSNPRTLNFVLGSIGTSLKELSDKFGEVVPPIQCLVINRRTGLPGEGIGWFVRDIGEFKGLSRRKQRAIIDGVHSRIFAYHRWGDVLAALGLEPNDADFKAAIDGAARYESRGESAQHKMLKEYIAANPEVVGLKSRSAPGRQECPLPSGDRLDVLFYHSSCRTAVEVKSRISPQDDIARGLFQCVKYRAVLRACIAAESSDDSCDSILALEGTLPTDLSPLAMLLGVKVVENVVIANKRSRPWNTQ